MVFDKNEDGFIDRDEFIFCWNHWIKVVSLIHLSLLSNKYYVLTIIYIVSSYSHYLIKICSIKLNRKNKQF